MKEVESFSLVDADVSLIHSFLSEPAADALYDQLLRETPWRQDRITLYGREMDIPRLQAWYGDQGCGYRYSGIVLEPLPWTASLSEIRRQVESVCKHRFNSVLINYYRSGLDSNGWHSDNEPELGFRPVIASLSLGAVRRFRLRHKHDNAQPIMSLDLSSGSLLVMAGDTQKYWQHCVTKTRRPVAGRINLTFRYIVQP